MKIQTSRLCVRTSVWVLASALCVATLAGCGATSDLTSSLGPDASVQGIRGIVHGGPNPVSGATVILYATTTVASPSSSNSYGYGVLGEVLGTTTTDSSGNFSFTGTETVCPNGQQAYIVSAGGNTGTNATNNAALLMAALGSCGSLVEGSGGTTVVIDEPTTIAAAYALSGFMTTTGNGSTAVVNISAPANNNAATAACTTSGTSPNIITTGCAASGLAHAFLNAANLVNSSTGVAYSTSPSNPTAIVPQALIYTLANTVEACVNSSGGSSTACTTLMTNTTPTQLTSPTAPTNTLQALLDLAQYPSEATNSSTPVGPPVGTAAGSAIPSAATTALFNVANSNSYYSPALTASPLDFTIAILYPVGDTRGSAADINDNIYVYENITPATLFSLSSKGAPNWSTAINTKAGCSSTGTRCSVTADALGNLWVVDNSGLTQVSNAGVLGTTYPPPAGGAAAVLESAGVDLGNNVWLGVYSLGTQTGASGIEELKQGASAMIDVNVNGSPEPYASKQPAFDSAGNLWVESDSIGAQGVGAILMLSDTGSLTSPTFATAGGGNGNPVFYPKGMATPGNGVMLDPSGNLWFSAQDDLLEVPSSGTETSGGQNYGSATVIYGPTYEAGVERNAAIDGDGKIIIDATSTGAGYLSVYYPNAPADGFFTGDSGADVYLNPCHVAPSTTVCQVGTAGGGQSSAVNNPRSTTIDAAGAIWSPTQSAGFVSQVLGPGAPTWSQKSYIPQALAPNLTGNTTTLRPY